MKDYETNLIKLKNNRIDGYAAQDITTDRVIASGDYGEIIRSKVPIVTKDYFLLINSDFYAANTDLIEKLWTKIGEIRESVTQKEVGRYAKKRD
ncbi:MAG: hypothetical protein HQK53_16715 [Oligoflexia bacterium]|nr:hypothetical protein [Oligoflexia bacterium]